MPDKAAYPLAAMLGPFGVGRDTLAQADERITALASGMGQVVDALAQRLNALPAAATFQPFANAQQVGLAGALQGIVVASEPKRKGLARQARRAVASAALRGTQRTGGLFSITPRAGFGPPPSGMSKLLDKLIRSAKAKQSRQGAQPPKARAVQAAAQAAQQAAQDRLAQDKHLLPISGQLAADLVRGLLNTIAPAAQATGGLLGGVDLTALATPQGVLANPHLARGLQDAMAGVLGAVTPSRSPRARAGRNTPQTAASAEGGVLSSVQLGGLVEALLDAITQGQPAARSAARRRPRAGAIPPAPAAPRAPARLLPPATLATPETAAAATSRAAPPTGVDESNAALDELHRALLDQAWLRGVDLR